MMITTISAILFLISFFTFFIGGIANQFLLIAISSLVVSVSSIIFSLFMDIHSKHIRKEFRGKPTSVIRIVLLLMSVAFIFISSLFVRDVPAYLNKDFAVVEGVPDQIEYSSSTRYDPGGLDVHYNDQTLSIKSSESLDSLKGRKLKIYYLPHSDWVVKYEVLDK